MLRLLRILAALIAGVIASYIIVLVAAFFICSIFPPPSSDDKSQAAIVFLVVGPALAFVGGILAAARVVKGPRAGGGHDLTKAWLAVGAVALAAGLLGYGLGVLALLVIEPKGRAATPGQLVLMRWLPFLTGLGLAVLATWRTARARGFGLPARKPTLNPAWGAASTPRSSVAVTRATAFERALGRVHIVIGAGGFLAGITLGAYFEFAGDSRPPVPVLYILPVFILVAVGLLAPAFIGGIGLVRGRVWGRSIAIVTSIIMLLAVPVGTVVGIIGLVGLYRRSKAAAPDARWMAENREIDAERAAYAADPSATRTCEHLAPVETSSRRSGIRFVLIGNRHVEAHCKVFRPSLERMFPPGSPVRVGELPAYERSPGDPPRLVAHCSVCNAAIVFQEPSETPPNIRSPSARGQMTRFDRS
ncbi:MAG: hypothetical protein U1E62_22770 [Alsobacter sp.]